MWRWLVARGEAWRSRGGESEYIRRKTKTVATANEDAVVRHKRRRVTDNDIKVIGWTRRIQEREIVEESRWRWGGGVILAV
jgi:hypothetical protein